jgi:type II secretory pathway component PulK
VSPDLVHRRGEAGAAMILALLVLFLVSISLALLAGSLQLRMRLVREDAETVILAGLSDGAVDEAMAGIAQDADYTGAPSHLLGGGTIESLVRHSGDSYTVVATATYDRRRRAVEALVTRNPDGVVLNRWRRIAG